MDMRLDQQYNPYRIFTRQQWAKLRDDMPMTLAADEIAALRSMYDRLDLNEVEEIYLPLSRLLSIYVDATQRLYVAQRQFLGIEDRKMPYIIGVAGSVAVGKSTTARVLQALLARMVAAVLTHCGLEVTSHGLAQRRAHVAQSARFSAARGSVEKGGYPSSRYRQLPQNRLQRGSKGQGLGLAFCKLAVEAHGGEIAVEARGPLPGAVFSVSIPIWRGD